MSDLVERLYSELTGTEIKITGKCLHVTQELQGCFLLLCFATMLADGEDVISLLVCLYESNVN